MLILLDNRKKGYIVEIEDVFKMVYDQFKEDVEEKYNTTIEARAEEPFKVCGLRANEALTLKALRPSLYDTEVYAFYEDMMDDIIKDLKEGTTCFINELKIQCVKPGRIR